MEGSEKGDEKMNKKGKQFFVYTVVLFSVTFILILFSSFTGIRYKDAQYEKSKLFHGAQKSIVVLSEENNQLKKDNEELLSKIQQKESGEKAEKEKSEEFNKNTDKLMEVQDLYNMRQYNDAAVKINDVNRELLSESSKKVYDYLDSRLN